MRSDASRVGPIEEDVVMPDVPPERVVGTPAARTSGPSVTFSLPSHGRISLSPGGHLVFVRESVHVNLSVAPSTPIQRRATVSQSATTSGQNVVESVEVEPGSVMEADGDGRVEVSVLGGEPATPYNLRVSKLFLWAGFF